MNPRQRLGKFFKTHYMMPVGSQNVRLRTVVRRYLCDYLGKTRLLWVTQVWTERRHKLTFKLNMVSGLPGSIIGAGAQVDRVGLIRAQSLGFEA